MNSLGATILERGYETDQPEGITCLVSIFEEIEKLHHASMGLSKVAIALVGDVIKDDRTTGKAQPNRPGALFEIYARLLDIRVAIERDVSRVFREVHHDR